MLLETSSKFFPDLPFRPGSHVKPSGDTSSTTSLQQASIWLEECTQSHAQCGGGHAQSLPTRVLDISCSPIRLKHSTGEKARYACLSHCWGSHSMLQTTMANIDSFSSGIPWEMLPKTFQDAVIFARALGLKYIWIDSLCIIQDDESSPSDWQKESARMASIYHEAYVTLAATCSEDSNGGCFTLSDQRKYAAHKMQAITEFYSKSYAVYARLNMPHIAHFFDHEHFPLLQRAWVYQERLLSPRTIHFAGYELQWECREMCSCECTAIRMKCADHGSRTFHEDDDKLIYAQHTLATNNMLGNVTSQPLPKIERDRSHEYSCGFCNGLDSVQNLSLKSTNVNKLYIQRFEGEYPLWRASDTISWRRILASYTGLKLTYTNDIFPALSGLAGAWHVRNGDEYVAGLWKKSLVHDLLWYSLEPSPQSARPTTWRAPSFSWASIDLTGPASYEHRSLDEFVHETTYIAEGVSVIDVKCVPKGLNLMGEIKSARLTLSCKSVVGRVYHWPNHRQEDNGFRLVIDDVLFKELGCKPDLAIPEGEAGHGAGYDVNVLCLAVKTFNSEPSYTENSETAPIDRNPTECLMLRRRTNSEADRSEEVYERVGYAFLAPWNISKTTRVPRVNRDIAVHPNEWPLPEPLEESDRRKDMNISFAPWKFDTYCDLARRIAEAPIQIFNIL